MDHPHIESSRKITLLAALAVLCAVMLWGCGLQTGSSRLATYAAMTAAPLLKTANASANPPTKTPIYAISGGKDLSLPPERCLDLDGGGMLDPDDQECDFAFLLPASTDSESIQFIPLSYSSFSFSNVFWDLPDPQTCSLLSEYSALPQWINTSGGYYVCFQTGQGHWGILQIKGISEDNLLFYWITYPEQTTPIAREPAQYLLTPTPTVAVTPSQTPVPEKVFSQGTSMWVKLDEGLDLDTGMIRPVWNEGDDLLVSAGEIGEDGSLINLLLDPAGSASIQGGPGYENPPVRAECARGIDLQTEPLKVDTVQRYHCFQTSVGRMGYVYIHESSPGVGIRLDWVTWPAISGKLLEPAPTVTAVESGAAFELVSPPQLGGVKVYRPGQLISFTWQLKNTGKTTWNTRHALVFSGGTSLGGLEKKWIPYPISPGMIVKLNYSLTLPKEPGTYTAVYWLMDDKGRQIGIGENGSRPLQLVLNVGEPGITLADGQNVLLALGTCFDLDLGYPSVDDPACDFSVSFSQDSNMLKIDSLIAAFDFDTLYVEPPRLYECKTSRLSSGRHVIDLQDWYVCFKTGEGRYGWLKIRGNDPQNSIPQGLLFDWKTYQ